MRHACYNSSTAILLCQAAIRLDACGVEDEPRSLCHKATMMRGFTERFLGSWKHPLQMERRKQSPQDPVLLTDRPHKVLQRNPRKKRVRVAATAASSTDATASTNLAVEVTCEDNTHDCPALIDERTTKTDAITPSSRVVIESIYWEDLPSGGQGHSMSDCSSESDDWGHDTHAHGVEDELDPISARPQKISSKELNRAIRGFKDREKETGVQFAIPVRDDAKIAFS